MVYGPDFTSQFAQVLFGDQAIRRHADPVFIHLRKKVSPPPLSQIQSVATGRDAIGAAAGAARGRRYFYMNGRGGRSRCPEYPKTIPGWPGIPQVEK